MEVRHGLSEQVYSHLIWAFIGSDGRPRQLNDLPESDRQAVFKGEIKGAHYWIKMSKRIETLEDGSIQEIIVKSPTTSAF
jgi:hypothetical protein